MQPILVFVEQANGQIKKTSLEAVSEARRQADVIKTEVVALVIAEKADAFIKDAGSYGANKVVAVEGADFKEYLTASYTRATLAVVNSVNPMAVLFSATPNGKDLAASVGAELKISVIQDCISLNYDNGAFVARRPIYAGKSIITVKALKTPVLVTLRPKVFPLGATASQTPSVEKLAVSLTADDKRVKLKEVVQSGQKKMELTEADIIVSGGRGMKAPENFKVIEELAGVLNAAVGASRAAVDSGWRPHTDQVGQTGKTVCPTLYVACGISGAIQHLAGMSSSKCIVAINKDPEAPIFKVANYGVVGDLFEVVPALCTELKKN
ncbi:MAG: electron transfer flavoprotein subunit alpha/FixB family protein [Planctomycetes bacterium]|nr:electron transfer flavoprotein subunit alpha/FixB family protein [Planctomycetota bacterium]